VKRSFRGAVFASLVSAGCGGEVESARTPECAPITAEVVDALAGTYAITSFLTSSPRCTSVPESPEDAPAFLSLKPKPAYMGGEPALTLGVCHSADVCRGPHAELGEYALFFFQHFSCSAGTGSLFGKAVYVNDFADGRCGWPRASDASLRVSSRGDLTLDIRTYQGADYRTAPGATCSHSEAEQAARAGTCFLRDSVRASKL
jgi:hypothetical protein